MSQFDGVKTIQDLWEAVTQTGVFLKVRIDRATRKDDPGYQIEIGYGCGTVRVHFISPDAVDTVVDIDLGEHQDNEEVERYERQFTQAIDKIRAMAIPVRDSGCGHGTDTCVHGVPGMTCTKRGAR